MTTTGVVDTGRRNRGGDPIWEVTLGALEHLPGFHREGGSLRATCPAHGGQNRSALRVSPEKGVGTCAVCGAVFIVVDHPAQVSDREARRAEWERSRPPFVTINGRRHRLPAAQRPPEAPESPIKGQATSVPIASPVPDQAGLRLLSDAADAYAARLPGSPGACYLAERHIPPAVAESLGWGWGGTGQLVGLPHIDRETGEVTTRDYFVGRVTMPLSGPDGVVIGMTGRAADNERKPKYKALDTGRSVKALTNGGAIGRAIAERQPLVIVEGQIDAAAVLAGGLPFVVAIGSTRYPWPRHFRGLAAAVILPDNDGEDGRAGALLTRQALELEGVRAVVLDPSILGPHKDVAAWWVERGELPAELIAAASAPIAPSRWARSAGTPQNTTGNPGSGVSTTSENFRPESPSDPLPALQNSTENRALSRPATPENPRPERPSDRPVRMSEQETRTGSTKAGNTEAPERLRALAVAAGVNRRPLTSSELLDVEQTVAAMRADGETADQWAVDLVGSWDNLDFADQLVGYAVWLALCRCSATRPDQSP